MATPKVCPEPERLQALVEGTLPLPAQSELMQHLEDCESCQEKLDKLAAGKETWAAAARHAAQAEAPLEPLLRKILEQPHADSAATVELPADFLQPPEKPGQLGRLGTYEVLEVTGRGG